MTKKARKSSIYSHSFSQLSFIIYNLQYQISSIIFIKSITKKQPKGEESIDDFWNYKYQLPLPPYDKKEEGSKEHFGHVSSAGVKFSARGMYN